MSFEIAWWQFAEGTSSSFPSESTTLVIATGEQYSPSAAKVAYALAIVSGETSWEPSTLAGMTSMSWPVAFLTPSDFAAENTVHRSIWLTIEMYAELTECEVAFRTVIGPELPPSALNGLYLSCVTGPSTHDAVHEFGMNSRRVASTTWLRPFFSWSQPTSAKGLKVDPGWKPREPP